MSKQSFILGMVVCSIFLACTPLHHPKTAQPVSALERLMTGNARFTSHHMKHPDQSAQRLAETASVQKPYAAIVTCSDSRVSPEIIFDEGIGDLFTIRNAGNIVEENDVLASVEYAVEHLGVRTVVVMGHEQCGAIQAITTNNQGDTPEHIALILEKLRSEPEEQEVLHRQNQSGMPVHECVKANVEHGVNALRKEFQNNHDDSEILVLGAIYDIHTGAVQFLPLQSTHINH